jgi:hypothetical protein
MKPILPAAGKLGIPIARALIKAREGDTVELRPPPPGSSSSRCSKSGRAVPMARQAEASDPRTLWRALPPAPRLGGLRAVQRGSPFAAVGAFSPERFGATRPVFALGAMALPCRHRLDVSAAAVRLMSPTVCTPSRLILTPAAAQPHASSASSELVVSGPYRLGGLVRSRPS